MNTGQLRWTYTCIALWFYLGWVIVFVLEGLLAQTLPTRDLTSSLDRTIPVVPQFVWFYVLCYVFPFVIIPLANDWHRFNIALLSIVLCTLVAFVGHVSIPIAFPKPQLGDSFSEQLLSYIHSHDFRPGAQNFPSLHVAITWIIYFACLEQGRKKLIEVVLLIIALLIMASTVLIKQHLFIDLIGGTALAFLVWWITKKGYLRVNADSTSPLAALKSAARKMIPLLTMWMAVLAAVIGIQLL